MDNEFESIIKAVKNIKLNEDEKFLMRQNVLNSKISSPYYVTQGVKSFYFSFSKFKFAPAFVVILIVILAGGTSAFAEKAIPGDFLYGIKTLVNEPVTGIFALTKKEKTVWQEQLVERRLGEVQKLISKNDLNETKRIYLEDKIKSQIDQFSINANELALQKNESTNSSDLNIRLQASLKAYQNVLTTISDETNIDADTKKETGKLLAVLAESQDKVRDDHKNFELNTEVNSVSVLGKQTEALNLLNSTKLLYKKEKVSLSANIQNQIDDKLREAKTTLQEGKTFIDSSDYANAVGKFQSIISLLNETKLLMFSNVIKGDIENDIDSGDLKSSKTNFSDIEFEKQD